jgi:hypothetical protein
MREHFSAGNIPNPEFSHDDEEALYEHSPIAVASYSIPMMDLNKSQFF